MSDMSLDFHWEFLGQEDPVTGLYEVLFDPMMTGMQVEMETYWKFT
jgi:hypothetical protein